MKIDLTQIIVAIIGFLGIVYAQRQQRKHNRLIKNKKELEVDPPRKFIIIFLISIAITIINLLILGWRFFSNDSINIKINHPHDGDKVTITEIIRGTSKNIPSTKMIWIIIYSFSSEKYFPCPNPALVDKDGNWTSQVTIGSTADSGKEFNILAYLADEYAKNDLEREFKQLIFAGLEKLPSNMQLYNCITVYRK